MACANVGPIGQRLGHGLRLAKHGIGLAKLIEEAPPLRLGAVHGASRIEQLGGAARADDARQHVAGPHVGAGKAHAHEQERRLGSRRAVAQVGGHGQDGAGAGANAVDGGHDRLRAGAHGLDEVARHSGEGQQPRHVALALHLHQRADDLVHVAAGAEVAAGARDHNTLDAVGVDEVAEGVAQLGVGFQGQRVLALGAVERDRGDFAVELPLEVLRPERSKVDAGGAEAVRGVRRRVLLTRFSGACSGGHVHLLRPARLVSRQSTSAASSQSARRQCSPVVGSQKNRNWGSGAGQCTRGCTTVANRKAEFWPLFSLGCYLAGAASSRSQEGGGRGVLRWEPSRDQISRRFQSPRRCG